MVSKFLVCLILIIRVYGDLPDHVPKEYHDWILSMRAKCIKETGITEDEVIKHDISNNAQPMMCYMKCMMTESKWMIGNQINYELIEAGSLGDLHDIVVAALNKCRTFPEGKNLCETAYNFNVCMQQADPVHYFLA